MSNSKNIFNSFAIILLIDKAFHMNEFKGKPNLPKKKKKINDAQRCTSISVFKECYLVIWFKID